MLAIANSAPQFGNPIKWENKIKKIEETYGKFICSLIEPNLIALLPKMELPLSKVDAYHNYVCIDLKGHSAARFTDKGNGDKRYGIAIQVKVLGEDGKFVAKYVELVYQRYNKNTENWISSSFYLDENKQTIPSRLNFASGATEKNICNIKDLLLGKSIKIGEETIFRTAAQAKNYDTRLKTYIGVDILKDIPEIEIGFPIVDTNGKVVENLDRVLSSFTTIRLIHKDTNLEAIGFKIEVLKNDILSHHFELIYKHVSKDKGFYSMGWKTSIQYTNAQKAIIGSLAKIAPKTNTKSQSNSVNITNKNFESIKKLLSNESLIIDGELVKITQ